MKITFIVDGIKTKIEVNPESILKDIIILALNRVKEPHVPDDFIILCNEHRLDLYEKLSGQVLLNGFGEKTNKPIFTGQPIYVIHKSSSNRIIWPRNPYKRDYVVF